MTAFRANFGDLAKLIAFFVFSIPNFLIIAGGVLGITEAKKLKLGKLDNDIAIDIFPIFKKIKE